MDDRALFDLGRRYAGGTSEGPDHLLDHELDVGATTSVGQNPDVFEAHQCSQDLTRVDEVEGASWLLVHNFKLEAPSSNSGGPHDAVAPR